MDATSLSSILFKAIIVVLLLVVVLSNTNTDIYNKINDIVGIGNWHENKNVTGSNESKSILNSSADDISLVTNNSLTGKAIIDKGKFEGNNDDLFETLEDMRESN